MALTTETSPWLSNASDSRFMKGILHQMKNEVGEPLSSYRRENDAYGSYSSYSSPTDFSPASFKDLSVYRNNLKKRWEFRVATTTYNELGSFYYRKHPPELFPNINMKTSRPTSRNQFNGLVLKNENKDIRKTAEKVSIGTQINENELNPIRLSTPLPHQATPMLPSVNPRENNLLLSQNSPVPNLDNFQQQEYYEGSRSVSPLKGILKKLNERQRDQEAWQRYMEERARFLDDLKRITLPEIQPMPSERVLPSNSFRQPATGRDIFARRSEWENGRNYTAPNQRHFYSEPTSYVGVAPNDQFITYSYNHPSSNVEYQRPGPIYNRQFLPANLPTPIYLETPWPGNTIGQRQPLDIVPGTPRNELFWAKRRGIREGNGSLYVY